MTPLGFILSIIFFGINFYLNYKLILILTKVYKNNSVSIEQFIYFILIILTKIIIYDILEILK